MKVKLEIRKNIAPVNLKSLIKENNFSVEDLASLFNVETNTINRWITGLIMPSFENYIKLAKLFEVSLEYLLGNTDIREQNISSYTINSRVKELREKNNYSKYKLEKLSGVQTSIINNYENGTIKKPRLSTYLSFAEIFEVSIDYLLGFTETETWELYVEEIDPFRYISPGEAVYISTENKKLYGILDISGEKVIFADQSTKNIDDIF